MSRSGVGVELRLVRQFALENQVCDFVESSVLGQVIDRIAAVSQAAAGGTDGADGGLARRLSPKAGSGFLVAHDWSSNDVLEKFVKFALVGVVVEIVVHLLARLHDVEHVALVALLEQRRVNGFGTLVHRPIRAAAIEHDIDPGLAQLGRGEQGRVSEFGDVGKNRHADRVAKAAVLFQLAHGLGKDHVGAGLDAGHCALDRRLLSFDGQRVGARHDDEIVAGARIHRHLDPIDHFLFRDNRLARPMAAALGLDLILDVHPGRTGLFQRADGALDIERPAEPGIAVHQQRQAARFRDPAHVDQHVFQRADAEIGQTQGVGGQSAAGKIDGLVADLFGHAGGKRVDGTDDLQRSLLGHEFAQAASWRLKGHGSPVISPAETV